MTTIRDLKLLIQASSIKQVSCCLVLATLLFIPAIHAVELKDSQNVIAETNREAEGSQQNIDRVAHESQQILEEYRRLQNGVEYQAAYTRELEQLNSSQQVRITRLKQQIEEAGITQQRIVPLMRSMADSLEKFVVLDLPFHHEERINAVLQLKHRLRQPDLPLPMKFRLLLETWQLEQDYGVSIEAWRGPLELADKVVSVEYLRIGRVALYYQSLDGLNSGYWEKAEQAWVPLAANYNQPISKALRVAHKQVAPELLSLPMISPGGGQ